VLLREVLYCRPGSVDEAVRLLVETPGAGVLAGGQSLINVMKLRLGGYDCLVDLGGIPALRRIEVTADGGLTVGAMVTFDAVDRSAAVNEMAPALAEACRHIADQQVRNRGTVGGNCCYHDPTCAVPPVVAALAATMEIHGPDGVRKEPAETFFRGYYQTSLARGEILVALHLPAPPAGGGQHYEALQFGRDGLSILHAAANVTVEDGRITACRVVLAGAVDRPIRLASVEARLLGGDPSPERLAEASQRAMDGLEPLSDFHASADYRRAVAPVIVRRALEGAVRQARREGQ
jgi:carbon-monoxide dehydrogenase medium subunit